MKINCLIIDDEALARRGLEKYVREIDFLDLKGVCKNAMEANSVLNREDIHLLFLDIEMPMLSGIEFLRSIRFSPKVIFTTAYSDYALESFDFDVIDYLVKPISFDRFLQAANKAVRLMNPPAEGAESIKEEAFVFIKTDRQLVKVFLKDILFVQAMQNYCRIVTETDALLSLVPLKKVQAILPAGDFIQAHKSYLISKGKVQAIVGNQLMIGEYKIPIGRSLKDAVMQELVDGRLLKK